MPSQHVNAHKQAQEDVSKLKNNMMPQASRKPSHKGRLPSKLKYTSVREVYIYTLYIYCIYILYIYTVYIYTVIYIYCIYIIYTVYIYTYTLYIYIYLETCETYKGRQGMKIKPRTCTWSIMESAGTHHKNPHQHGEKKSQCDRKKYMKFPSKRGDTPANFYRCRIERSWQV